MTAVLVFYLCRRSYLKQADLEAEKMRIFRHTVDGVYHILRNYLNQMQLVTFEAKECPDFDPEVDADRFPLDAEEGRYTLNVQAGDDARIKAILAGGERRRIHLHP